MSEPESELMLPFYVCYGFDDDDDDNDDHDDDDHNDDHDDH